MAYQILKRFYMCRAGNPVRLYSKPNDITPSRVIMPAHVVFTTNAEITVGSVTFLRVDDYEPGKNMWIPTDSLEMTPIESDEPEVEEPTQKDDSVPVRESLLVNGSSVAVYDKWDSSTPISSTLELGSTVYVDRKVNVTVNGVRQTRYRINGVVTSDGEMDDDCLGCWVLANYAVTIGTQSVVFNNSDIMLLANVPGVDAVSGAAPSTSKPATSYNGTGATTTDNLTVSSGEPVAAPEINGADDIGAGDPYKNKATGATTDALYDMFGFDYTGQLSETSFMGAPLGRLMFVHGMPFQFTHITDRRTGSKLQYGKAVYDVNSRVTNGEVDFYGRVFAKEIVSNMPIAVVVPGVPEFMTNVKQGLFGSGIRDKDMVSGMSSFFRRGLSDTESDSILETLINDSGGDEAYQYFSMRVDTAGYYQYVNALCRTSAKMMGLSNTRFRGVPCDEFDWGKYNTAADQDYSMFEEAIGADGGVSFAFDPLSSITDSLSNSTTESRFASMLNGISSKAKELSFLTGTVDFGTTLFNQSDYESAVASLSSGFGSSVTNPISKIVTFLKNSAHGFNIRFPEIWSDTQSSKSYDIDMKFIAPYNTPFCKWRYVLVPFFHWFCLAAPHSDKTVANYSRPYLIRAFSKGYFNVEMGMVKDISWKRFGDGDMISEDGIPTEIDVSVSFEDLYQSIAVSKLSGDVTMSMEHTSTFFNNTGLMDLIGTLSGVNMNKISIRKRLELYVAGNIQSLKDTPSNLFSHASQRVRNIFEPLFLGT